MPSIRNRNFAYRWGPGFLVPGSPAMGVYRECLQNGFAFDKTTDSNKDQVLPYTGTQGYARLIRNRHIPGLAWNSYYEPGVTASTPYLGDSSQTIPYRDMASNKAYSKFKDKALGDTAQLGAFIAEGRQSYGMIANRATGLYRSYRQLRRGNFRGFLKELSVNPKRKHSSKTRAFAHEVSGLWLEYWFGWSPAVNDMFAAVEQLNRTLSAERLHGVGMSWLPERSVRIGATAAVRNTTCKGKLFVKTGATCRLVNPDAALSASLGLANPLSIAWEVVPFSFVVDWFTKFGNVLNAKTDFLGIELMNAYTTLFYKVDMEFVTWFGGNASGKPKAERPAWNITTEHTYYKTSRVRGLAYPVALRPKLLNFGSSVTRAATAVSLLTSLFIRK